MKKIQGVLLLLVFSVITNGCGTIATYKYMAGPNLGLNTNQKPLKVAVLPFKDLRGEENTSEGLNAILKYMIPIVPFVRIEYDRPDIAIGFLSYTSYNFRPSEDLAKSVVDELKANDLFEEVFFSQREYEPNVDLYLTGEINDTTYSGKLISYGLSVFGPVLWVVGLPAGTTHNSLSLNLTLKRASDGEVVWSHMIEGNWGKTVGIYYNLHADFDGYPLIMKEGVQEGIKRLANELQIKDLSYWKSTTN